MERIERRLIVPADLAGRRLDQAAALLLPEFSRSRLKNWIDAGRLTIAGRSARAGLVHRLDKDTSGLLLVARTLASHKTLVAALERRGIRRGYQAICQGVLTGGGSIDAPIGRHPRERTRMAVVDGGREARTRYRVLERFRAHTHCEIELETGRTHQIRLHMAHIRAPPVRDPVYGRPP